MFGILLSAVFILPVGLSGVPCDLARRSASLLGGIGPVSMRPSGVMDKKCSCAVIDLLTFEPGIEARISFEASKTTVNADCLSLAGLA